MKNKESPNVFVLRIKPSGQDRIPEALHNDVIMIGWAEVGKELLDPKLEWAEFRDILHKKYYAEDKNLRRAGIASGSVWRFIREMKEGDIVIVPAAGSKFHVAEIVGDEAQVSDSHVYQRKVKWWSDKEKGIPREYARSGLQLLMKMRGTCISVPQERTKEIIKDIEFCLERVTTGKPPSFAEDLEELLIDTTLKELRKGRVDNYKFEEIVAMVLRQQGASEIKIVSRQKDKGIDVLAKFPIIGDVFEVVGVQAKHYEGKAGDKAVEQLINGIENEEREMTWDEEVGVGMVITTAEEFTDEAEKRAADYEEKKGIPIRLIEGKLFAKMIIEHGLNELNFGQSDAEDKK